MYQKGQIIREKATGRKFVIRVTNIKENRSEIVALDGTSEVRILKYVDILEQGLEPTPNDPTRDYEVIDDEEV